MSEVEVPQPISDLPARWGGLTTGQLAWLVVALLPPLLGLRLHLALAPLLAVASPWAAACTGLGFGIRRGRRLDAYLMDAVLFRVHPHRLVHPGATPHGADFRPVDLGAFGGGSLPWRPAAESGGRERQ